LPVLTRREETAAATRRALLRAARRLFERQGYAATRLDDVTARARVTKGALYHHFADKRELFEAVHREVDAELAARLRASASTHADPWAQLVSGCREFLDAAADPAVQQIVLLDAPSVIGWSALHDTEGGFGFTLTRELLAAAIEAGEVPRQPVEPLTHLLLGAINEGGLAIARADDAARARKEIGAAADRLLAALRVRG
jgi:AcrR family transcriptional regulator